MHLYLKMTVKHTTSVEVRFPEMHGAELSGCGDVHEFLLLLDLLVPAMTLIVAHLLDTCEFGMKLLQALFTQMGDVVVLIVILLKLINEGVFIHIQA